MIVASAIKFFYLDDKEHKYPQIWTEKRHSNIFERMAQMNVKYDKKSYIQGFLTDCNAFLDRCEAAYEAYLSHQITWIPTNSRPLYSEDIWPE